MVVVMALLLLLLASTALRVQQVMAVHGLLTMGLLGGQGRGSWKTWYVPFAAFPATGARLRKGGRVHARSQMIVVVYADRALNMPS